jgi:hypothetical protein
MRISFGKAAPAGSRYEIAWSLPPPPSAGKVLKTNWWLESVHAADAAAVTRFEEVRQGVCAQGGSAALYQVTYDENKRIVSERVVARRGAELPPLRVQVQAPDAQLKIAVADLLGSGVKPWAKNKGKRGGRAAVYVVAAFVLVTGMAAFFGASSWQMPNFARGPAPTVPKHDPRAEGQILVQRPYSSTCERYVFDNRGGGTNFADVVPCEDGKPSSHRPGAVTSFTTGLRGGR